MPGASDILDARILIVDDQEANVQLLEQMLTGEGYTRITSTMDPHAVCALHRDNRYDLILLDLLMPSMDGFQVMESLKEIETDGYLPVLVITAQPGHKLRALQAGAKDFIGKPFDLVEVKTRIHNMLEVRLLYKKIENFNKALEQTVQERTIDLVEANKLLLQEIEERKKAEESLRDALKEVKELKDQLRQENIYLREEINLMHSHGDIVGGSEAIRTVFKQIEQVAPTDSTVLIQGETGTGKELIAHAVHNLSSRKGRLMIKVNCAALPPTLIESELFGREKGAFTGSLSRQLGRFELAHDSTIFLDEIDSLPLELQAKLLRVLESGEFERLGSPLTVKVDVRIISATNRDLAELVGEGGFREDLYYRLNVFQVTVPPLRERREDIMPLVWSFVEDFSKRMGKRIESIPQLNAEALQAYPWPGNIRELRNVTERAMIISSGPVLHMEAPKIAKSGVDRTGTLEEVEKRRILEALGAAGWQVSGKNGAAEILDINPKTLESRMQKLGIYRNRKNV
jgi:formate hydrogenlyase transcriptional activator